MSLPQPMHYGYCSVILPKLDFCDTRKLLATAIILFSQNSDLMEYEGTVANKIITRVKSKLYLLLKLKNYISRRAYRDVIVFASEWQYLTNDANKEAVKNAIQKIILAKRLSPKAKFPPRKITQGQPFRSLKYPNYVPTTSRSTMWTKFKDLCTGASVILKNFLDYARSDDESARVIRNKTLTNYVNDLIKDWNDCIGCTEELRTVDVTDEEEDDIVISEIIEHLTLLHWQVFGCSPTNTPSLYENDITQIETWIDSTTGNIRTAFANVNKRFKLCDSKETLPEIS